MSLHVSHARSPSHQLSFDVGENPSILSLPLPPPAPARGYQRSRTTVDLPPLLTRPKSSSPSRSSTFLPFLRPQSTRSLSPERISPAEAAEFAVQTIPEESAAKKKVGTAEKLAAWFDGTSEPINITLVPSPRKEKLNPVEEAAPMETIFSNNQDSTDNLTRRLQKKSSLPSPSLSSGMSKFNFFRRSTFSGNLTAGLEGDELAQLDIREALFPQGPVDQYSPSSFKNLQLNAEGTLRRFQTAHRDQQKALRAITSAHNVQADELEAAQTRNEHLKLQLQDMAERASEQERVIADLKEQLRGQRSSLRLDRPPEQSVRLVSHDDESTETELDSRMKRRRKRSSDVSTSTSCESEADSEVSSVVSIFSEPLSAASSHETSISSPVLKSGHPAYTRDDCPKCHGLNPSEAWDVVGVMRMESSALKQRITQLENAQDEALDFLSGLKLS